MSLENILKDTINLHSPEGASARISPYGGHLLSWITSDGRERLFLSPRSEYRAGEAIRGGVPVIFPQFASLGSLPKHGFARVMPWKTVVVETESARLRLVDTGETRAIWPYRFQADITYQTGNNRMEMELEVTNRSGEDFSFTAALHTYLRVNDALSARVKGLNGLVYLDSANGRMQRIEESRLVTFTGEVDRIYLDAKSPLELQDDESRVEIRSSGFPDAVIWNPGAEKCALLADMEPDGWRRLVCVEAAAAGRTVHLAPGATWRGTQILSV